MSQNTPLCHFQHVKPPYLQHILMVIADTHNYFQWQLFVLLDLFSEILACRNLFYSGEISPLLQTSIFCFEKKNNRKTKFFLYTSIILSCVFQVRNWCWGKHGDRQERYKKNLRLRFINLISKADHARCSFKGILSINYLYHYTKVLFNKTKLINAI